MTKNKESNLHLLNGHPTFKQVLIPSFIHAFACAISTIMPVIILLNDTSIESSLRQTLIQNAFFVSAFATFLQTMAFKKLGARLPIIMGSNFTFLITLSNILQGKGYDVMLGSIIAGGVISLIFGLFAKYINSLITPLTKGLIVFAVGASIILSATQNFAGGTQSFGSPENFIIGIITVLSIILFEIIFKGNIKNLSILFGIVIGFITAICFGIIDFTQFALNNIISLPKPYMHYSFDLESIITVSLIYLIGTTEILGNTNALADEILDRDATKDEIIGSVNAFNISSIIAGLFGVIPMTIFSPNIALVKKTKIINRFAVGFSSVFLLIFSIFPFFSSMIIMIPNAVLSGATLTLLGSIIVMGISMISRCGLTERNITISAISITLSVGMGIVPNILDKAPFIIQTLFTSPVSAVFIISSFLQLVIPYEENNNKFRKLLYGEFLK